MFTLISAIIKYSTRAVLRNVLSLPLGAIKTATSVKSLGFSKALWKGAKITFFRNLKGLNYFFDWKKKGFGFAAKRFAINKLVPVEIRKIYYFFSYLNNAEIKKMKGEFESLMGEESQLSNFDKLTILENMIEFEKTNLNKKNDKTYKVFNFWIAFTVNSPETGNFSQQTHYYNFSTKKYKVPIRGASWINSKYYVYDDIKYDIIKLAMQGVDYGRIVFSLIRTR